MMLPGHMELVIAAFSLVIFSSIAVNWHRYILLDEVTASEKIFRLDRPVWSYAGRTLLIMLVTLVPVVIFSLIFVAALPNLGPVLVVPLLRGWNLHYAHVGCLAGHSLERKDFGIQRHCR